MPANIYSITQADVNSWPTSNYINPVERNWLPAFAISWQVVSTVLLSGRFYLRARNQAGPFCIDDLLIFIAWLCALGSTVVSCIEPLWYQVDRHIWDVEQDKWTGMTRCAWIAQLLFLFGSCATKLSVYLFYRRMLHESFSRLWITVVTVIIWLNILGYLAFLFAYCFICLPLSAYWDYYSAIPYTQPYSCLSGNSLTILTGFLIALSDLLAVVVPYLMLRRYHFDVPRRQRVALNVIFSLGLIAFGVGLARTYYLWQVGHSSDISWQGFNLEVTSLLECQLGIICACAPSLRAFFRYYFAETFKRGAATELHRDPSHHRHRSKELREVVDDGPPVIAMRNVDPEANSISLDKEDMCINVTRPGPFFGRDRERPGSDASS